MRIQSINSAQSFGKTPVMYCKIQRNGSENRTNATLYKLDIFDHRDIGFAKYSQTPLRFVQDMYNDKRNTYPKEYYVMTDNETGRAVSYAETSNHIRIGGNPEGGKDSVKYLLINEFNKSDDYVRAEVPMFAFFAEKATASNNPNIVLGTSNIEETTLKKSGFSQTNKTEWYMPKAKYTDIIDFAKRKFRFMV